MSDLVAIVYPDEGTAAEVHQTLAGVSVDGDDAKQRIVGVLRDHGSERVKFFGKWSVETLAGPL